MIPLFIYLNLSIVYNFPLMIKLYSYPIIIQMFDQVYLTGFKIFGDYEANPTQLLTEHFAKTNIQGLNCSTVEVTTKDADIYIQNIKEKMKGNGKKVLNLHFGVGPNKIYHLERCCYNNKDFCIPDNLGYQPKNQQICGNQALEYPIFSKLDLNGLVKELGKNFPVQLSIDPGRYLCNYIYFKSCHDLSMQNQSICSQFIHFPPLSVISHEKNVQFVSRLLELLLKKTEKVETLEQK